MLQEMLGETKDFRVDRCKKHNLVDILMTVLIGILCGHKDIEEIHFSAEVSEDNLKNTLSFRTGFRARTRFSAFASSMGFCFGQVKTDEKSNETAAIPELLALLDLKGVIVTIDAMGCQKAIAEKNIDKESDYLFSLKGNQEKIHGDVKAFFDHELDEKYCKRYKIQSLKCGVEKDYGRIERREYHICTNHEWL